MKFFVCKKFGMMIFFGLFVLIATVFCACGPVDNVEAFILTDKSLTVEVGQMKELKYSINPENSIVSFKTVGEEIFSYNHEDGKVFIFGLVEGSSSLQLSVLGNEKNSSVVVDIEVIEKKGSASEDRPVEPPVENPEEEPDKTVVDAGDLIQIDYFDVGGGKVFENEIVVRSLKNGFSVLRDKTLVGEMKLVLACGETSITLKESLMYVLPKLEGANIKLMITISDSEDLIYIKSYNVTYEID